MAIIDFFAGLMAGRRIASQRVIVPVTPTPTLYLYGVPSESGNIGLRNGESVAYYDGVVGASLPVDDTYPIAFVIDYEHQLITATHAPLYALSDGGNALTAPTTAMDARYYTASDKGDWNYGGYSFFGYKGYRLTTPFWTNADIVDETSGEVFLAASDPIPVSGIVGYSYNGTVLPELPEWDEESYPYAAIVSFTSTLFGAERRYGYLHIFSSYEFTNSTTGEECIKILDGINYSFSYKTESEEMPDTWGESYVADGKTLFALDSDNWWTNFDLYKSDGTLAYSASDPIPVYDKE